MQVSPIQQHSTSISKQNFRGTVDKSVYQYAKNVERQLNNKSLFPNNQEVKTNLKVLISYLEGFAGRLTPDSKLKLKVQKSNVGSHSDDLLVLYTTDKSSKMPTVRSSKVIFKDEPLYYSFNEAVEDLYESSINSH